MAYPFFSLAKTHRTTPIYFRMNEIAIRVEAASAVDMNDPKVRGVLFGQRAR